MVTARVDGSSVYGHMARPTDRACAVLKSADIESKAFPSMHPLSQSEEVLPTSPIGDNIKMSESEITSYIKLFGLNLLFLLDYRTEGLDFISRRWTNEWILLGVRINGGPAISHN